MGISTTGSSGSRSNRIQILGAAVCAAAAGAVLVAVAAGVWRSAAPSARVDSPPLASADQGPVVPTSGRGGSPTATVEATERESVTVYLVASAEEADAIEREVRAFLRKHEAVERDGSLFALPAGTAEEQARARVALRDLRLQLGDDKVRIVDVRSP